MIAHSSVPSRNSLISLHHVYDRILLALPKLSSTRLAFETLCADSDLVRNATLIENEIWSRQSALLKGQANTLDREEMAQAAQINYRELNLYWRKVGFYLHYALLEKASAPPNRLEMGLNIAKRSARFAGQWVYEGLNSASLNWYKAGYITSGIAAKEVEFLDIEIDPNNDSDFIGQILLGTKPNSHHVDDPLNRSNDPMTQFIREYTNFLRSYYGYFAATHRHRDSRALKS